MNNYRRAIPAEIQPQPPFKYEGSVLVRSDTYTQAERNINRSRQEVKFYLPNEMSDFRDATLQFKIDATPGTGGSFTRFNQNISCIIQRFRIQFGSTTVVDVDNYNVLHQILALTDPVDYNTSTGIIMEGTGGAAARNADYTDANRVYALKIRGVGLLKKILPLHKISTQMQIILTLADPNNCIETDHTNTAAINYNMVDPEFHYSVLSMSDEWNSTYDSFVSSNGGYDLVFRVFDSIVNSGSFLAGNTQVQIQLPFRFNSLLGIMYVSRDTADVDDFTALDKLNTFNELSLDAQRYKINSSYYPLDSSRSIADYLSTFMDMFNIDYHTDFVGAVNFRTSSFVAAHFVGRHPKDNRNMVALNGLQTSTAGTSIINESRFAAPLANNQTVNFYAFHETFMTILPNGSIQFTE